jgi:hypothetical protein
MVDTYFNARPHNYGNEILPESDYSCEESEEDDPMREFFENLDPGDEELSFSH